MSNTKNSAAIKPRKNIYQTAPGLRQVFREWGESLAIALVLALILRHFVVEAFKIPTKSMEPTLIGDTATGDKILVCKFVYDFWKPERGDVVVFKYPEDPYKNYIKRLIGLPNEEIQIWGGDIYSNGKIWRKPYSVQRALWMPASHDNFIWDGIAERALKGSTYNGGIDDEMFAPGLQDIENWQIENHSKREKLVTAERLKIWRPDPADKWEATKDGLKVFQGKFAESHALVRYRSRTIYDRVLDASGKLKPPIYERFRGLNEVDDLAIRFRVRPEDDGGEIIAVLADTRLAFMARIPVGKLAPIRIQTTSGKIKESSQEFLKGPEHALPVGKVSRIAFMNVDDTILLEINGRQVINHPYKQTGPNRVYLGTRTKVKFGVYRTDAEFTHIRLERDIFYLSQMTGVTSSEAKWKLKEGEYFVLGDNSPNSKDSRLWPSGPTVPEENLIGEAFMVFWPPKRLRIIR